MIGFIIIIGMVICVLRFMRSICGLTERLISKNCEMNSIYLNLKINIQLRRRGADDTLKNAILKYDDCYRQIIHVCNT